VKGIQDFVLVADPLDGSQCLFHQHLSTPVAQLVRASDQDLGLCHWSRGQFDSQAGSLLVLIFNTAWQVPKYFVLPPCSELGHSSSHPICVIKIYRGRQKTFLLQKKSIQNAYVSL